MCGFVLCTYLHVSGPLLSASASDHETLNILVWAHACDAFTVQLQYGRGVELHMFIRGQLLSPCTCALQDKGKIQLGTICHTLKNWA